MKKFSILIILLLGVAMTCKKNAFSESKPKPIKKSSEIKKIGHNHECIKKGVNVEGYCSKCKQMSWANHGYKIKRFNYGMIIHRSYCCNCGTKLTGTQRIGIYQCKASIYGYINGEVIDVLLDGPDRYSFVSWQLRQALAYKLDGGIDISIDKLYE